MFRLRICGEKRKGKEKGKIRASNYPELLDLLTFFFHQIIYPNKIEECLDLRVGECVPLHRLEWSSDKPCNFHLSSFVLPKHLTCTFSFLFVIFSHLSPFPYANLFY